jgi:XTP/dITP diphosphohydrolase
MRIYLASGNAHKVGELQELARAAALPVEILSAREVGGMPAVVEDAGTFEGNARKKAVALAGRLPAGAWALADDSGLCVAALDGAPGVESAYYAGPQGDGAANLAKLVEVMRAVPDPQRAAHFVCVLCLIGPEEREYVFEGRCLGRLLHAPRGGAGFGYDPLFVPAGHTESFAELGEAVKNAISHRARAWQQLAGWLRSRPGCDYRSNFTCKTNSRGSMRR